MHRAERLALKPPMPPTSDREKGRRRRTQVTTLGAAEKVALPVHHSQPGSTVSSPAFTLAEPQDDIAESIRQFLEKPSRDAFKRVSHSLARVYAALGQLASGLHALESELAALELPGGPDKNPPATAARS